MMLHVAHLGCGAAAQKLRSINAATLGVGWQARWQEMAGSACTGKQMRLGDVRKYLPCLEVWKYLARVVRFRQQQSMLLPPQLLLPSTAANRPQNSVCGLVWAFLESTGTSARIAEHQQSLRASVLSVVNQLLEDISPANLTAHGCTQLRSELQKKLASSDEVTVPPDCSWLALKV